MKSVPDSELLSAYLDGELTADELALVEKMLAASPDARQLMEELRALSGTLQSLPRYELGEDLSEQVLRRAERQILTTPRRPVADAASQASWRRRLFSPRVLAWSGIAVAVAVWMMVTEPGQLATRPGEELADSAASSPPSADAELLPAFGVPHDDYAEDGEAVVEESPALQLGAKRGPAPHPVVMTGEAAEEDTEPRDTDRAAAATTPSAQQRLVETRGKAVGRIVQGKGEVIFQAADNIQLQQPTVPAPRAAATAETPTEQNQIQLGREGAVGTAGRFLVGKGVPPLDGAAQPGGGRAGGEEAKPAYLALRAGLDEAYERLSGNTGQVALVYCDITQKAVEAQAVNNLLISNGIAVDGEQAGSAVQAPAAARGRGYEGRGPQAAKALSDLAGYRVDELARSRNLDVVYVEATPAQISATLSGLAAQTNDFLSLAVQPAPRIVEQQVWSRYNRQQATLPAAHPAAEEIGRQVAGQVVADDKPTDGVSAKGAARATDRRGEPWGQAWRFQLPEPEAQRRLATQTGVEGGTPSQQAVPEGMAGFGAARQPDASDRTMEEPSEPARENPIRGAQSEGFQRSRAIGQAVTPTQRPPTADAWADVEREQSEPQKEPAAAKLGSGVARRPRPDAPSEQGLAQQLPGVMQQQLRSYQVLFVFRVVPPTPPPAIEAKSSPEKNP